ncbi:MAG TPA: MFS transporter [Acetobacteraceae bacterium]|nr:MFS transporter [Acetobacteraceae bacterium]
MSRNSQDGGSSGLAEARLLRVRAERGLDILNVLLADVRYGLGPYATIYLMSQRGWDEASLALAGVFGGVAGLVCQAPIGAAVDAIRSRRGLIAGAILVLACTSAGVLVSSQLWHLAAAGVIGALAGIALSTALSAISLGIVGPDDFTRRAGRNEALFHAGSCGVNVLILAAAPFLGIGIAFFLLAAASATSVVAVLAIPRAAIDDNLARGLTRQPMSQAEVRPLTEILRNRGLLVFAICGALFHLANASMLGLVVQRAARGPEGSAVQLAAASMIAAQLAMIATAMLAGRKADLWGRRPFFLAAFAALAVRGMLYTVSDAPGWTVFVQLLDGVGVGVFGALFPVVVADLSRGAGHFNAAQGAVGTVHLAGGLVSAPLANLIAVGVSYDWAFRTLSAIAFIGGVACWYWLAETRPKPSRGGSA